MSDILAKYYFEVLGKSIILGFYSKFFYFYPEFIIETATFPSNGGV